MKIISSGASGFHSPNLEKISFNLNETEEITGFSTRTIRRFVARGLLHPVKASRRLIFSKSELLRFLDETTSN